MHLNKYFELKTIKNKQVFVVDDHHKVLAAWALIRRKLPAAPNLITIDHHTDINEAFLCHANLQKCEGVVNDASALRTDLVAAIDWTSDQSISKAIELLQHDEHISAATSSETIADAFCIQLSDSFGTESVEECTFSKMKEKYWPRPLTTPEPIRPFTYETRSDHIYPIPFECFIDCHSMSHDDGCLLRQANEIIEASYLDDQLKRASEIASCIGFSSLECRPYILDVDLDVFHTRQAISPEDPSTLYRLIRNAIAITIATESECVGEEWLDDDDLMSADELLDTFLAHIAQALR